MRRYVAWGVSMGTFLGVPLCAMDQRVRSAVFIIGGARRWEIGDVALRGFENPVRLYEVRWPEER